MAASSNPTMDHGYTYDGPGTQFTGKERDSESNLDNFGARYNTSSLGRFMSPDDPLVFQITSDPQSWNLYTYARNNPLSYIDPTGHAYCRATTQDEKESSGSDLVCITDKQYGTDADNYMAQGYTHYDSNIDDADKHSSQAQTNQSNTFPLTFPLIGSGTGVSAWVAPLAMIDIGLGILASNRIGNAIVQSQNDQLILEAASAQNLILMAQNNKSTQDKVNGLVAAAATELGKISSGDPNRGDNHHRSEAKAMLDRAERLAKRLPRQAQETALQAIRSLRGIM